MAFWINGVFKFVVVWKGLPGICILNASKSNCSINSLHVKSQVRTNSISTHQRYNTERESLLLLYIGWVLATCNTCVRLHSTPESQFLVEQLIVGWFYFTFIFFVLLLLLFLACLLISPFKIMLLLSLFWFLYVFLGGFFFFFISLFSFVEGSAVFISL